MPGTHMKSVVYKMAGPTALFADVYLPDVDDGLVRPVGRTRPILLTTISPKLTY